MQLFIKNFSLHLQKILVFNKKNWKKAKYEKNLSNKFDIQKKIQYNYTIKLN